MAEQHVGAAHVLVTGGTQLPWLKEPMAAAAAAIGMENYAHKRRMGILAPEGSDMYDSGMSAAAAELAQGGMLAAVTVAILVKL